MVSELALWPTMYNCSRTVSYSTHGKPSAFRTGKWFKDVEVCVLDTEFRPGISLIYAEQLAFDVCRAMIVTLTLRSN